MNRRIAVVAAALALALGGLPLLAQQGPGGRGGRGGPGGPMGVFPGLAEVGLTDAQREQVRSIMEQERQTSADPREKLRQAEEALHAAILADAPDQRAIESAKAALGAAQGAELDARVQLMGKIAGVLTSAQRQQLAQLQPRPGGRRGGGPGGHR
jgi:protein CpxP